MKTREIVTMGILSAILLAAQVSLGFLPNIELVTLLLIVYTLVLKKKVFFVIYVFVLLEGMILWIWSLVDQLPVCLECAGCDHIAV